MAEVVLMKHKETGLMKNGFYGFSWTTLFFGAFPALFRQDFITFFGFFALCVVLAVCTYGTGLFAVSVVWAFMYNKYYTRKLIEKGYVFCDTPQNNALAMARLGISDSI